MNRRPALAALLMMMMFIGTETLVIQFEYERSRTMIDGLYMHAKPDSIDTVYIERYWNVAHLCNGCLSLSG
jgi:hypothetical protein